MQCSGSASLICLDTYSQAGLAGTNDHACYLKPGGSQNCRNWLLGGNPQKTPKSPLDRYEASFEYDATTNTGKWIGSNLGHSVGHVSSPGLKVGLVMSGIGGLTKTGYIFGSPILKLALCRWPVICQRLLIVGSLGGIRWLGWLVSKPG